MSSADNSAESPVGGYPGAPGAPAHGGDLRDNARDKSQWRALVRDQRDKVPPDTRTAEAEALTKAVCSPDIAGAAHTVCGYVPFGSEPGSLALLDALLSVHVQVLLPVIPERAGPLDWAPYTGPSSLRDGPISGLKEPAADTLGSAAISRAEVVLVPALAVDRSGVRLGKGGGYYDRSLPLAAPETELIAVVRDTELVDELPTEPHDVRMTGALTPGYGHVRLPAGGTRPGDRASGVTNP
ncbi:5-formyltetrahydrofolate cyclo-ligase [Haloechinothrix sp. LS1_15]|uniref:5-formyltetrahydrofolate cyclo-ligase n=1 Tax=Haloechinothrix sp. LS1_15 TaxID=2652248 RepID=UPI002947D780|nr:5-formyltetrahydrofolate cyclo-ligase [Haloechinothrix sp. LS1_15]MDV6014304.1 5-formyltetrahydrofolate cyclo-ligase [Haloechinothrix sp. LS1_15]